MPCEEGDGETRILVAPDCIGKDHIRHLLQLLHPKTGDKSCYLFSDGILLDLQWFKQSYGSWFVGNYVCEDGRLYTATPVDPIFILLPIFEEARMKKGDDSGKFRQIDEIIFINGYPGYRHLLFVAEKAMPIVCDVKEVGSEKYFRLDDSKVLAWLCVKVNHLKRVLPTLGRNYAARDEKDTLMDAISILGEYLKEPWLKLLCDHLKMNLQEVIGMARGIEMLALPEGEPGPSELLQEKSGGDQRVTRSGKQSKKPKMEERNSRNIQEMFRNASKTRK